MSKSLSPETRPQNEQSANAKCTQDPAAWRCYLQNNANHDTVRPYTHPTSTQYTLTQHFNQRTLTPCSSSSSSSDCGHRKTVSTPVLLNPDCCLGSGLSRLPTLSSMGSLPLLLLDSLVSPGGSCGKVTPLYTCSGGILFLP